MPMAIPLIMAAVEVAGGVAAVTAATATMTAMVLGGLAIAGGALTMIGTVTGNKTLSTLGMVAGLAGGVGSMMAGAGTAGAGAGAGAADSFDAGAADGVNAADGGAMAANPAVDAANPDVATSSPVSAGGEPNSVDLANAPPSAQQGLATPKAAVDSTDLSNLSSQSPVDAAKNPVTPLANSGPTFKADGSVINQSASVSAPTPVTSPDGSVLTPSQTGLINSNAPAPDASSWYTNANGAPTQTASPSMWDNIKGGLSATQQFAHDNSTLMNAAGGIVSGAMKSASEQSLMKERYQQQMAYEQANRDRINASIRGLAVPTYSKG